MRRFLPLYSYPFMAVFLLAVLFKLMHWEGADSMLIVALGSLIFVIPFYFIIKMKDASSTIGKISYLLFIPSLLPTILGILFKIMHWPGADMMLILGVGTLIFPTLICYVIYQLKKSENKFKDNFSGFFAILLFMLLVLTFLNKPKSEMLQSFESMNTSMMSSSRNLKLINNEMITSVNLKTNKLTLNELHILILQNHELIDSIKNEIIEKSNYDVSGDPNDLSKVNIGNNVLSTKGTKLYDNLKIIQKQLKELKPNINTKISRLYSKNLLIQNSNEWIYIHFAQHPVIENIATLSSIQNDIQTAENEMLLSLTKN